MEVAVARPPMLVAFVTILNAVSNPVTGLDHLDQHFVQDPVQLARHKLRKMQ